MLRLARLAKKQQLDTQAQLVETPFMASPEQQVPHTREANVGDATPSVVEQHVVEQDFSPAIEDSLKNSAEEEPPPPQEADLELQAQLKSREDDRKAVDHWLANRVWVAPPKPKPKSEVYIPPSPFGRDAIHGVSGDANNRVSTETQDPSTAAPSSETDSGRLRSG